MWKYFKVVIKVLFPIIWAYFSWMIRYSNHPEKYPFDKRWAKVQKIVRKVIKAFNVQLNQNDIDKFYENMDKSKNHLFVCNHISDIDPLIFIAVAKRPITFVAKIESEKYPLVGRVIKIIDGKFMDRDDLKQSLKIMLKIQDMLLHHEPIDVVIFPEGTRNKQGDLSKTLPYHHGSFRPAFKAKSPIDVFMITGDEKVLTYKNNIKKFDVNIALLKTYTEEDYANLTTNEVASESQKITEENLKKYY